MKKALFLFLLCYSLSVFSEGDLLFEQRYKKTHFSPTPELGNNPLEDPKDLFFRALAYSLVGDYKQADHWLDSLDSKGTLEYPAVGRYYLLRGRVYRLLGDNLGAVTMFDSALVVNQQYQNTEEVFRVYIDLLEHCRASLMFDEAQVYIGQLNKLMREERINPELQARFLHRKAALWIEAKDSLDYVDELLLKSISISKEYNFPWHEATASLDLGYMLFVHLEGDGLPYIESAEDIWARLGYRSDLALARFNSARIYSKRGQFDEALRKLDAVYADAVRFNWEVQIADVWKLRSEVYEQRGQKDLALEAYHTYHTTYTELLAARIEEEVAEMIGKMGAQTARNDLLRAENEMLVAEEALKVESNRKSIFLLISFSLLIILTGLYVFYQRSKLANSRLRAQQQIIEKKNQELELASAQKSNLYRELHHRVKNNLTNLSGLLYLQERGLNSEEAKKALGETRSRIQSMSLVHEGLYEQDEDVRIHFNTYLSELMPNLLSAYGGISERVDWSLDCEDFELEMEIAMPLGMIVNELITNSFKYAFLDERAGKLTVIGRALGKNGWVISIQDDGPGMPEQFDWEHPDSLGLKLVKVFVDEMGAEFSYGYFDGIADFSIIYQPKKDAS